ncbi:MAG TPA: hypothetical protein VK600_01330 [Candidatus Saccharimonadales bacterium]|nr:hypothetical protein [Candidatus Saccharimonadales bacterium]
MPSLLAAIDGARLETEVTRRLAGAGVPMRFQDRRLATFTPRPGTNRALQLATAAARRVMAHSLVLVGPPGTGKTHLAVGILAGRLAEWLSSYPVETRTLDDGSLAVRPSLRVGFLGVPKLLDTLRYRIGRDDPDPLPGWATADLLVLDDLGREKQTDWALERLYVLVNERYEGLRPTIVTSNLSPDELSAAGHDAIISRLTEGGKLVLLSADDHRRSES